MPDMGFRDEHIPRLLSGDKPFTIRRAWKNGKTPAVGARMRLVAGWRTPQRRVFATALVAFRATITFDANGFVEFLHWRRMKGAPPMADNVRTLLVCATAHDGVVRIAQVINDCNRLLARLDGFEDYPAFWRFHTAHRKADLFRPLDPFVIRELIGFAAVSEEFANA